MADFSRFNKLAADGVSPRPYQITEIPEEEPKLMLLPATRENKPYWNEAIRRVNARGKRPSKLTPQQLEIQLREDMTLIAQYCIVGWSGVVDNNGADVPFTKEDALEFLTSLPAYISTPIRDFCREETNFVGEVDAGLGEA